MKTKQDVTIKRFRTEYLVPAGTPVEWHAKNAMYYVKPSVYPRGSMAWHDAEHYGFQIAEDNIARDPAPKAEITIDIGSNAFAGSVAGELARILRDLADRIEGGELPPVALLDANGERIGKFDIVDLHGG